MAGVVEQFAGIDNEEELERSAEERKHVRRAFLIGTSVLVAVVAIVVAVLVREPKAGNAWENPYQRPVESDTVLTAGQSRLDAVRTAWEAAHRNSTQEVDMIPPTEEELASATLDANSVVRAARWVVSGDAISQEQVPRLFALAIFYYALEGPSWTNSSGWLSYDVPHCDWYGVKCAGDLPTNPAANSMPTQLVYEIDLVNNNLVGELPVSAFRLLDQDVRSVLLYGNVISGPLSADIATQHLEVLHLQHNKLTGAVPNGLDRHVLNSIYVQGNELSGEWPESYCSSRGSSFEFFGMDCDYDGTMEQSAKVDCSCCDRYNCFSPGGNDGTMVHD